MKKIIAFTIAILFMLSGFVVNAAQTSTSSSPETVVILSVPGMDCPVCPITVKKALVKVPGVNTVKIDFKARTATITFDANKTNVEQLEAATTKAGYPSTELKKPAGDVQ